MGLLAVLVARSIDCNVPSPELLTHTRSPATTMPGAWPRAPLELPSELSLREIAEQLYVSHNTIKTHAADPFSKAVSH